MQLPEYLERRNISQGQFAKRMNVSRQLVHKWCTGVHVPSLENAFKIRDCTGGQVDVEDWLVAAYGDTPNLTKEVRLASSS